MQQLRKLAHIINPFVALKGSDHAKTQVIAHKTMRIARDFAVFGPLQADIDIHQFAVVYPEDEKAIPTSFIRTYDLERSVLDIGKFKIECKLPIFKDIIDKLYEASDADYFIVTDTDICLMPHFYVTIEKIISMGFDAFLINKRVIPGNYAKIEDLPLMYTELGTDHAGCDCFVFPRKDYLAYRIGTVCIGKPWAETTLATSMAFYAKKFGFFRNPHLTFHIGDPRPWLDHKYDDYRFHNTNQFGKTLSWFKKKRKKFMENDVVRYFFGKLKNETYGYGEENYSKECLDLLK